jgi:hypothetical protein
MSFVVAAASRPASVAGAEVGSSRLGPPRKPATTSVAVFFAAVFVVVAFAPTSVASGSSGLGPSRTPGAAAVVVAFVVVFVALRRVASPVQRAVAVAAAPSLLTLPSSADRCHNHPFLE